MSWVALLAVGWALIIWPQMPQGFLYQSGLEPSEHDGFPTALYFSMTTLATLGFGDIVPTSGWLRILEPLQAFTGFAVLTASVSWILSIYPALTQRYALAHQVNLLRDSEREPGSMLLETNVQTAEQTLHSLTTELITVKGELVQFPITYYFYNNDDQTSLPRAMPYLAYLAERMSQEDSPLEVRFRAGMLRGAIHDFASTLGSNFLGLPSASTTGILEAYARDHFRRTPPKDEESSEQDR